MTCKRVIVIGGGFGGLNCVKALNQANLDVLLIDKRNHHLFQPLLYQVATAVLSPTDIAAPLREILAKQCNTTVLMGSVEQIDKDKKELTLAGGERLSYDYLVVATGASHSYFGRNEWEPLAPGLKTVADALNIRERILLSFEKAERMESAQKAEKYLSFVVIGGGPTGVEMAGAIAEIAHQTMAGNFRRIHPEKSKIYLIEGAPRILPFFPPQLSERATQDLEKMGVRVLTARMVVNVTAEGVQVGEDFIEARNVIWAAGNVASPLLKTLGTPLDRQGRAIVEEDLSIPGYCNLFVIGDAACVQGKGGQMLPAVAPTAIQQGRYVGKLIRYRIPKERRRPFKYFDKGGLATIGKNKAVGYFKGVHLKGFLAWIAWGFIHIAYLVSYRNRSGVMLDWIFHYIAGLRTARLIHQTIEEESRGRETH